MSKKEKIYNDGILYKNVWIDTTCLYMPELLQNQAIDAVLERTPCVIVGPDIERGFDTIEDAKRFIDTEYPKLKKECDRQSKLNGIPF